MGQIVYVTMFTMDRTVTQFYTVSTPHSAGLAAASAVQVRRRRRRRLRLRLRDLRRRRRDRALLQGRKAARSIMSTIVIFRRGL